ncbi:3-isopropylmalate dehydratase small subunit [Corynebacterium bovis]|uniref:3-isopropylmalate dehydratase small subunit n=1 Tax=Corynebacterium bovis TaxID=36808 RepID=UPI0024475705|nr:3-isopropylmalate dehydratase small subunit [Corynebacterium bovis]MDH2455221.1 3-isopropylmalate dehydratase small subunit [Corynebacterium bovis]
MEKFTVHTGVGLPLRRSNVDTDQIVPAQYLKLVTRTGFAEGLFTAWRRDPGFILNQEPYRESSVLVAGPDFGTGSSREHAVWALLDYGFRAVFSPRFGDIFRGNAGKNGLLAATLPAEDIELMWKLLEERPGASVEVDLLSRTATLGTHVFPFEVDDDTRHRLLEGLDDIAITLHDEDAIAAFEAARPSFAPRTL